MKSIYEKMPGPYHPLCYLPAGEGWFEIILLSRINPMVAMPMSVWVLGELCPIIAMIKLELEGQ